MKTPTGTAIGAGLVFSGVVGGWLIAKSNRPEDAFVLTYKKAGGTMMASAANVVDDPTDITVPATQYASFIASRCRLERWVMDNNASSSDTPHIAELRIPSRSITDRQFNCLTGFIKPGYVTLARTTY